MTRFRTRKDGRRAFTLMEVMLVLALMAIIAAIAWPSLQIPLAQQRLKSAVDEVRSKWCEARVNAMQSGHTYAFRYQEHGGRYRLCPKDDPAAANTNSSVAAQPARADDAKDDPLPPPVEGTLPVGIRLLPGDAEGELATLPDVPETAADQSEGWSDPIYFYADGTTSDARIIVARNKHAAVRLLLRGITGTASIDDGRGKVPNEE